MLENELQFIKKNTHPQNPKEQIPQPELPQAEGENLIASYMPRLFNRIHGNRLQEKYATVNNCVSGLLPDGDVDALSPIAYANRAAQILYNIGVERINADDGLKIRYGQLIIPKNLDDTENTKEFLQAVFVIQTGLDYIAKLDYDYQKIYNKNPESSVYKITSINSMSNSLYDQLKTDLNNIKEKMPIVLPYIPKEELLPKEELPSTCQLPSHQTLFYLVNLYICEHPEKFKLENHNLSAIQNALPEKDESLINLCKKYMEQIRSLENNYNFTYQDQEKPKQNLSSLNLNPSSKNGRCSIF